MPDAGIALRWLIAGDLRHHPARVVMAVIAIAVGVALGFAVHLVNASALASFGAAIRTVNGAADLQVKAASTLGMAEAVYPRVIAVAGVADASPVVELKAAVNGTKFTLLGVDVIRAAGTTPTLIGARPSGPGSDAEDLFATDALFVSRATLAALRIKPGDRVVVTANGRSVAMTVRGVLPGVGDGRRIGVVDIAAAQWRFGRLGTIDRIDVKLADGADAGTVRARLAAVLPATALVSDSSDDASQGDALSRAYRVNLQMLALVALLTGTFLVYSTQSLGVARRLQSFALLRTLGMQRSAIVALVAVEGALTGVVGTAIGLAGGYALAALALRALGGDLGGGYFGGVAPTLIFAPAAALGFVALGLAAAIGGSILPALQGARAAPAVALKNAGDVVDPRAVPRWQPALVLLVLGIGSALMPAIGRLPVFGYVAVALMLAAGIAAMPWAARALLAPLIVRPSGNAPFDLAVQHLRGAPAAAAIALCGIVASTSLMIAMAVMVTSFRGAVDEWLGDVLSGDLYLRSDPGSGGFDRDAQAALAHVPGVRVVAFNRQVPVVLAADRPAMTLIARRADQHREGAIMLGSPLAAPPGTIAVSLSEPASRLLDKHPGDTIALPLGSGLRFFVTGVWRDYARQQGAIAIDAGDYERLTGDAVRDEAMVLLRPGSDRATVTRALVSALPASLRERVQVAEPATLRRFALSLFDRSFAITYALEAVAIIVGLAGVAATSSAQAIARTREFGMLRHLGVSRGQIVAMLGAEGGLLGIVGGIAGVALGIAISQVLIHVVNPQSFNWTMTTRLPVGLMLSVIAALVTASLLTAMVAGRRAVSVDAVRAVRADW